jgi:hypothetical protein
MMMNATPPSASAATPPAAPAVNYTLEEFYRLAARCEGNPGQVQAVAALYQAKLINFKMLKDMLQLSGGPQSSVDT